MENDIWKWGLTLLFVGPFSVCACQLFQKSIETGKANDAGSSRFFPTHFVRWSKRKNGHKSTSGSERLTCVKVSCWVMRGPVDTHKAMFAQLFFTHSASYAASFFARTGIKETLVRSTASGWVGCQAITSSGRRLTPRGARSFCCSRPWPRRWAWISNVTGSSRSEITRTLSRLTTSQRCWFQMRFLFCLKNLFNPEVGNL